MQTPRILSGIGCLKDVKEFCHKPFAIISDRGLGALGLAGHVRDLLGAVECITELEGEPTAAEVDKAADVLRGRDLTVVGLGGGSALDLAKLAASVAGAKEGADHYAACANPLPKSLPTVLIPTTAGTGSEMSRTAVFTTSTGEKSWAWGEELQADIAVLDPELSKGLPLPVTVLTAVDALSHALEAATAQNQNSITNPLCVQAVSIIPDALAQIQKSPDDLKVREALLNASALAGIALNSCGTGLAHALAHGLASLVKVSHGLAIAWSLRVTLEWNPKQSYSPFPWLCEAPFETLSRWLDGLHIPALPNFDAEELARILHAPENQPMLDNNARPVTKEDTLLLARRLQSFC